MIFISSFENTDVDTATDTDLLHIYYSLMHDFMFQNDVLNLNSIKQSERLFQLNVFPYKLLANIPNTPINKLVIIRKHIEAY